MVLSQSNLLPSKLPSTWGSIPKLEIPFLDSGCNPYASQTWNWPPNQVPLTCKPPGLRKTCLGHVIQLLITSGFIPEPSKYSTQQSLHFPSFLCKPNFQKTWNQQGMAGTSQGQGLSCLTTPWTFYPKNLETQTLVLQPRDLRMSLSLALGMVHHHLQS